MIGVIGVCNHAKKGHHDYSGVFLAVEAIGFSGMYRYRWRVMGNGLTDKLLFDLLSDPNHTVPLTVY